jgi:fatty-acyl-CoA synthase
MTGRVYDVDASSLVWDRLCHLAAADPGAEAIVHVTAEGAARRWTRGQLIRSASSAARWLGGHGVRKGDVCALIIRHHPDFYPLYLGVSALGALPSVLAYPNARLHPDKFREGLQGMSRRSGLDHVITERDLAAVVAPLVSGDDSTIRQVLFPFDELDLGSVECDPVDHAPAGPDEPCLLQHSSGTTGLQKPVVLSHRAVLEHVRRYGEAIALSGNDRIASWLPLYHDMGLIAAFYLPLLSGIPLVQLSPMEWVASPVLLLQAISRERATLCWLPNFAYNLMADRVREEDLDGVRLDSLRMLVNCSEPIRAYSHDKFRERFGSRGLRREALGACYAMAETTYAVTQTIPGREAPTMTVDRNELSAGKVVPAGNGDGRTCVSSGQVVPGCRVRIVDERRAELPPGTVGEVAISSVSMFDGYRNYPEKTAEVLRDGWFYSGDLGFVHGGEHYVIGRKKDLIIVAGNNVFPEDVEDAVSRVPGIIPGRVVAFGAEDERSGTEVLCVIAEADADADAAKRLSLAVKQAGMAVDVTISRVYLVAPRWLIKSSAGKPSRAANKVRALEQIASS